MSHHDWPNQDRLDIQKKLRSIVIVGPPGSGKGTQGRILGKVPGYWLVSMGEIFRSLDTRSDPGRRIQRYVRSGELVPGPLVLRAWETRIQDYLEAGFRPERDRLILDGVPRCVEQAELLQAFIRPERIIHLACEDESLLVERIRHRAAGRRDDQLPEVIDRRFEVYWDRTAPLLDWYPSVLIADIDAANSPLQVLNQIVGELADAKCDSP